MDDRDQRADLAPVHQEVVVPRDRAEAFAIFTERMGEWWPLAALSVGMADSAGVSVDGRQGGTVTERLRDGSEADWGTLLVWEPPARLVMTWHPGHGEDDATEVEVRFDDAGEGTRVVVEHSRWDRHPNGAALRTAYLQGRQPVLAAYAAHAS